MSNAEFNLDRDIHFFCSELIDDEDDTLDLCINLIQGLTIENLGNLKLKFKTEDGLNKQLTKDEFVEAIDSILGNSKYSLQAISLFNEIPFSNEDKITWIQFIDYYLSNPLEKEQKELLLSDPNILPISHVGRETIIKIVPIETETSFCYAIISKFGKVGLYSGDLVILTTYQIMFTRSDDLYTQSKRKKTTWVTDAIFIPTICIFVVTNSGRSLLFYDAAKQNHIPLWIVEGIPNPIYSMEYYLNKECNLWLGNDFGSIISITFLQYKEGLFRRKYNDKVTPFYWRELKDEKQYIKINKYNNLHTNLIISLKYNPEICTLTSCSKDHRNSVVFYNIKERKPTYSFKINQGVTCFCLNNKQHLLLTGNDSGDVLLWNLYVQSKPIASLAGHSAGIVDLKILTYWNGIVTCSKDGMLKIWDLKNHSCLQSIHIDFPCFGIYGKLIEWGTNSIYSGPKRYSELVVIDKAEDSNSMQAERFDQERNNILVPWKRSSFLISCCNYIAKISISNEMQPTYLETNILPPPLIQNDVVIPNNWKFKTSLNKSVEKVETKQNGVITVEEIEDTIKYHPILKNIIERNFIKSLRIQKEEINYKMAKMELKKIEMVKPIKQCAPYLALDIHNIKEIKLTPNLPVPNNKETEVIAERTYRILSTDSTISEILSDRSSKSKSSKSSIVEFS